jgi:hypothetical protein
VYQPPLAPSKLSNVDEYAFGGEIEEYSPDVSDGSVMNAELGQYVMEQAIARLLFHSGFEGLHPLLCSNPQTFKLQPSMSLPESQLSIYRTLDGHYGFI